MNSDRFFIDTAFVLALLNKNDDFHDSAKALLPRVRNAREVWIHDGILIEVANWFCNKDRQSAIDFIRNSYNESNMKVVPLEENLFRRAIELYEDRMDKEWSLTDCISFVLMQDMGLTKALTSDQHFQQARFQALLRQED
jgi:hypothetical protein